MATKYSNLAHTRPLNIRERVVSGIPVAMDISLFFMLISRAFLPRLWPRAMAVSLCVSALFIAV